MTTDRRLRQVLLFLVAYLLYGASRWVVTGDQAAALAHARWIVELEQTLGISVEASVQQALDGTTALATWLLALPVFWLLPVAPPRLAGLGIADTITQQTGLALDSRLTTSFYNRLAAVPSLHCGFALAVSLVLAGSARRRWTSALAFAWAPTVFLAVVATGNHFVLGIVAGIAITTLGFAAARLAAGRRRARRRPAFRPVLASGDGRHG